MAVRFTHESGAVDVVYPGRDGVVTVSWQTSAGVDLFVTESQAFALDGLASIELTSQWAADVPVEVPVEGKRSRGKAAAVVVVDGPVVDESPPSFVED